MDPCGGQLRNTRSCSPDVCHVTFSSRGGAGSVARQLHDGQLRGCFVEVVDYDRFEYKIATT